jgi:hypothetical protein
MEITYMDTKQKQRNNINRRQEAKANVKGRRRTKKCRKKAKKRRMGRKPRIGKKTKSCRKTLLIAEMRYLRTVKAFRIRFVNVQH